MYSSLLLLMLLLLGLMAPAVVRGCSCQEGAFRVSMSDAIRSEFCSTYNVDVYLGMVIGATCNCIPEEEAATTSPQGEELRSSFLNCYSYQLSLSNAENSINTTILTRGQCDYERYDNYFLGGGGICSGLGMALSGLRVEAPPAIDAELLNLTLPRSLGEGCRFACSFNTEVEYSQPCTYTVRVMEVFKGNYSANDVIEVNGPDVLTSCGNLGHVLNLTTVYVAGIGQACSPVSEWARLEDYEDIEIELLTRLRDREVECGASPLLHSITILLSSMLITTFL